MHHFGEIGQSAASEVTSANGPLIFAVTSLFCIRHCSSTQQGGMAGFLRMHGRFDSDIGFRMWCDSSGRMYSAHAACGHVFVALIIGRPMCLHDAHMRLRGTCWPARQPT